MAADVPDAPPRQPARHLLLPHSRSPRPPHRQDHRRRPRHRRKKNKKGNIVTENFLDAAFVSFRRLLMDRASLRLRGTATLACPEPALSLPNGAVPFAFSLCRAVPLGRHFGFSIRTGTIYRAPLLGRCSGRLPRRAALLL